jgi:hypothetical protein
MELRRPKSKTLIYLLLIIGGFAGMLVYNSDTEPPALLTSNFSPTEISLDSDRRVIDFSVHIRDARGVKLAELRCVEENHTLLLSRIVMSGSFAGRVSFGAIDSGFNWVSSWDGNRYDFAVSAQGILPPETQALNCSWYAYLEDSLGNSQLIETGHALRVN